MKSDCFSSRGHLPQALVTTVNERCLLCHRELPWVGMKPSICKSPLCKMGNEGFGLAFDLRQELIDAPEVVDLLITMAYCATKDNGGSCMNFVTPVGLAATDPSNSYAYVDFRKPEAACAEIEKDHKKKGLGVL